MYEPDEKVTSHASLSDCTSHKAQATWASLTGVLNTILLDDINTLYIISDSPTSQYRTVYNGYLSRKFAEEKKVDLVWVFTESGHGKGPMDGVGSAVKRKIDDTLSYNPYAVIRCTEELIKHLPPSYFVVTISEDRKSVV